MKTIARRAISRAQNVLVWAFMMLDLVDAELRKTEER